MFNTIFVRLLLPVTLVTTSLPALAEDLLDVFSLAEKNDPTYLQATAEYRAALEAKPQAVARLLPLIDFSGDGSRVNQEIENDLNFGATGGTSFENYGYSLNLTQPLFRYDRFIALGQADNTIKQAEAELSVAQQELIIRIAERYFDVLANIDNLAFAEAEVASLSRQLDQANQRFEVGLSAITDVTEAQAGYDLATAREIQAQNAIDNAFEAMRELTGQYISEFDLLGDDVPLVRPDPEAIEDWTETSLNQNLSITAASFAAETARQEIKVQRSGHYPTLDLIASKSFNSRGGQFGNTEVDQEQLGLQLNVPLFAGGLVNSQTREAYENYNAAMHTLEQARRSAQRLTREGYLGVISGISQVKALNQAVISGETALEATEAGFEVGTRTAVDVVATQRTLSDARRNYSQAKYEYILNTLRLKQAAGTLSPDDLQQINNWLTN